jgi:oligopeptide/dipeptide ABC transporter ATP-binding protein
MVLDAILTLDNLRISYPGPREPGLRGKRLHVRAVDGVSVEVVEGQTLALVGESGCGKSTIAQGILRLVPVESGRVLFRGHDVLTMDDRELRKFRRETQIVFQDPYSSLHPRKRIGTILAEPLQLHLKLARRDRQMEAVKLLEEVGLPSGFARRYASELSGGQRQRVAIARALALRPKLVILDEPVSALDVSIRAQIIELLLDVQQESNLTYIFISHDLALVRAICSTVAVMYLGRIVESGPTQEVFAAPAHPYTRALLASIPVPDPEVEAKRPRVSLEGEVPSPLAPPSGCPFHPRCRWAQAICSETEPAVVATGTSTDAACHFWENVRQTPLDVAVSRGRLSGDDN